MDDIYGYISCYLQDIDGITVGSTTYKIANGAKMLLKIAKYPTVSFKLKVNSVVKPGVPLDNTKTFLEKIGGTKYSGFDRPVISIEAYLPITDIDTQANYFGTSKYSSTSITPMNYYLLWNMAYVNHKYYLTDIKPSESHPDLCLPINILQHRTDIFNKQIFDSSKGVPVVINNISQNGDLIMDTEKPNDNWWMPVKIELLVDE